MSEARREEPAPDVAVVDDPARHRFEAVIGGDVGFLDYRVKDNLLTLVHTEVAPALRGQGIGEKLVRFAMEHARTHGLQVAPLCPYAKRWLEGHPEYAPLLRAKDGPHA
jgi:predicted GNAT family acetyltransferase